MACERLASPVTRGCAQLAGARSPGPSRCAKASSVRQALTPLTSNYPLSQNAKMQCGAVSGQRPSLVTNMLHTCERCLSIRLKGVRRCRWMLRLKRRSGRAQRRPGSCLTAWRRRGITAHVTGASALLQELPVASAKRELNGAAASQSVAVPERQGHGQPSPPASQLCLGERALEQARTSEWSKKTPVRATLQHFSIPGCGPTRLGSRSREATAVQQRGWP